MNVQLLGILVGLSLLLTLIICFLPNFLTSIISTMFSFGKLGVNYSRRYRDNRDRLAYLFMFIGFLYSILFVFVPYQIEKIVFSGLYAYFFLITIAQYYRIYTDTKTVKRFMSLSAICIMACVNYICCLGLLNEFGFVRPCAQFGLDILNGSVLHLTYFLANMNFISFFTSSFMYMFAFYCLLAQFKYLRLEDQYKARNPLFLWVKVLIVCAIMVGTSYFGFIAIKFIFNVK